MKGKLFLICGAFFSFLATAVVAESPQSSGLGTREENSELIDRIERLESRVGSQLDHTNYRPTKRLAPTAKTEAADYQPEK